MTQIRITTETNSTFLSSPYHPALPERARALGGKFDRSNKVWIFDARDEERVRELAREI